MPFTCLLVHGTAPQMMNLSTVVSIHKVKNVCLSDSANYRGISLSSIFGKPFDSLVLDRFHDQLCLSDLQFGFRRNRSTDQCTMVLKETIAYYVHNLQCSAFFSMQPKHSIGWSTVNYLILYWPEICHLCSYVFC